MIDLEPIITAAQEALKTRNLNELFGEEGYAKRGTDGLNQFGWSRLYKILLKLLPFTVTASPQTVIELCAELKALRAENAALRLGQHPGAICGTACDPRVASILLEPTATGSVYVPRHWPP